MQYRGRKIAFVTAATDHGTMIVNRFDYHMVKPDHVYGVGIQILESGAHDRPEVKLACELLDLRRRYYGDGVCGIDCGANIGVHTIEWAKHVAGWGNVVAIEPQERIYYALAGNIAINNCFNARAIQAAVSNRPGEMKMPVLDYLTPASFGSLEVKRRDRGESIGQPVDYSDDKMVTVKVVSIDSLELARVDFIKIDIEGMEIEALEGASRCLSNSRPILMVEMIKTDKTVLRSRLEGFGYSVFESGMHFVAVHKSDKCAAHISSEE